MSLAKALVKFLIKNKIYLGIFILLISAAITGTVFIFKGESSKNVQNIKDIADFSTENNSLLCKVSVEQPDCYESDFPTPTLIWSYCDETRAKEQKNFFIQIDDDAYFNNEFPSPVFESGLVNSSSTRFTVEKPGLEFGKKYYWGVTFSRDEGRKEGWWGWGDDYFIAKPSCKRGDN